MTTVYCIGKNYAAHAKELGSTTPTQPLWFLKPESSIISDGGTIRLPSGVGRVDHEVELAIRLGPGGEPEAYTVAIDVTARDLQSAAKKAGQPWTKAKGFDTFLPLGSWLPVTGVNLDHLDLSLAVNGRVRQQGNTGDMTWSVAQLLHDAATWTTLRPGDIILTGTPEGVGPLAAGDEVEARAGEARLHVRVA